MANKKGQLRIGTSGWQYPHWDGTFYPEEIRKKDWFNYYAERFDTVEVNNTFYNLPKASTFDDWREVSPEGFLYVLKYSRYGTHLKRLKDPESHTATFLERAERLAEHLGPILVQLPPNFGVNIERLDAFLRAAPGEYRWAVEFRNPSWLCDEVFETLRKHQAALAIHDLVDDHPWEVTAGWVYLRYHGPGGHGDRGYPHQKLSADAGRIRTWLADGIDVYGYFNNDVGAHAPHDALRLRDYAS